MKIELAQAWWRLGKPDLKAVEDIATQALLDGFDSPALRELAWPDSFSGCLWEQVLQDLGQPRMSEQEAVIRVFVETARQLTTGELAPYEGALRLWRMGSKYNLKVVWGDFLMLSEEIENWEGNARDPALVNADIVRQAHRLLREVTEPEPGFEWFR